jgi:hypothetical protein
LATPLFPSVLFSAGLSKVGIIWGSAFISMYKQEKNKIRQIKVKQK